MLRIAQEKTDDCVEHLKYVPLRRVNIQADIHMFVADVTITQIFRNDEQTPIEAVYCFPIEEKAAIYSFIARMDDREIISQLKEKKEAQKEYQNALQQGHGAYLLEQEEQSHDCFLINIGALNPGMECTITIAYVTELEFIRGSIIEFVLPTTIAPRYNPDHGNLSSPANTNSSYVQASSYTIDLTCRVDRIGDVNQSQIARINSTSHPIEVDMSQEDIYVVTFAQENTYLDRDILINIVLVEQHQNTFVAVEQNALSVTFTPNERDFRRKTSNETVDNEFMFIIDCSGSMADQNKIELARQAMLVFLKSLPVYCHFNILRFGSNYQSLFKEITTVYNEDTVQQAEQVIHQMQADLGGTELLQPLQWLERHPPTANRIRQSFLLTDGEISNVSEVLDLCRSMESSTRIFSFGLGHSPSRALIKGLARSTNGRFVFIPPKTNVDIYVGEQLQKALQPCITNVQVNWNLQNQIQTVPTLLPPVYANDRLIIYGMLDTSDGELSIDSSSSIELISGTDHHQLATIQINRSFSDNHSSTIARLAAKVLILELQHEKTSHPLSMLDTTVDATSASIRKKRTIDLSLRHNILSPHTAFIGIEKRTNTNNTEMVLREIPIQISTDDRHLCLSHSTTCPTSPQNYATSPWASGCPSFSPCYASTSPCYSPTSPHYSPASPTCMASSPMYSLSRSDSQNSLDNNGMETCKKRKTCQSEETWSVDDQDIVRQLIIKQKFNGLWDLDIESIEKLTAVAFPMHAFLGFQMDMQTLVTIILISTLETRFLQFELLWHGVVRKARTHLNKLFDNDSDKLNRILKEINEHLSKTNLDCF